MTEKHYQIAMIPKDGEPKMLAFTYPPAEAKEVAAYLRKLGDYEQVFMIPRRRAINDRHHAATLLKMVRALKAVS